ncbi:MAG: hypothetical protein ABWZ15_04990 [Acidimicrobiia bacterium]
MADTRERLAKRYFASSEMRTAATKYLLAYEDTNSFYRAFRTWAGSTPEAVRNARPALVATGR